MFLRKILILDQLRFQDQEINTQEPAESIHQHYRVVKTKKKNKTPTILRIKKKLRNNNLILKQQLKKIEIKKANLEKLWCFDFLGISFNNLTNN